MLEVLILRFDAPLVSFGATAVDSLGVIQEFPALSMLTGLLGNALGYEHRDADKLRRLQERVRYAVRCDRPGTRITDYQTVDLSQKFMTEGWTTRGAAEGRQGGPAKKETHQRYRDYWADSVHTVAITLEPADESPELDALEHAILEPFRPLFIGRKCCLPAAPLRLERRLAASLVAALREVPRIPAPRQTGERGAPLKAWWPAEEDAEGTRLVPVTDERDWENQIVAGRRLVREGRVSAPEATDG